MIGGVADRPQVVELELPDPEFRQGPSEGQDFGDALRGDGHGRAGRNAEIPSQPESLQGALVAALLSDAVGCRPDALQRNPEQVQRGGDLGQAALDAVPVGADLDAQAQFLLGVADDLREVPVDEGLSAEQGHGLGAVLVPHREAAEPWWRVRVQPRGAHRGLRGPIGDVRQPTEVSRSCPWPTTGTRRRAAGWQSPGRRGRSGGRCSRG